MADLPGLRLVRPSDVETMVFDWGTIKWMSEPRVTHTSGFTLGAVLLEPGKGHERHNHPGAIDTVNFGPLESVPEKYRQRRLYIHNANVTLMRTTPAECAELGRITAEKLNRARGPVVFLMPLRGVSAIDSAGLPFSWPEADQSYLDALKANLDPRIRVAEVDAHINDEAFARNAAHCLLELLEQSQGRDAQTV